MLSGADCQLPAPEFFPKKKFTTISQHVSSGSERMKHLENEITWYVEVNPRIPLDQVHWKLFPSRKNIHVTYLINIRFYCLIDHYMEVPDRPSALSWWLPIASFSHLSFPHQYFYLLSLLFYWISSCENFDTKEFLTCISVRYCLHTCPISRPNSARNPIEYTVYSVRKLVSYSFFIAQYSSEVLKKIYDKSNPVLNDTTSSHSSIDHQCSLLMDLLPVMAASVNSYLM